MKRLFKKLFRGKDAVMSPVAVIADKRTGIVYVMAGQTLLPMQPPEAERLARAILAAAAGAKSCGKPERVM